MLCVAKKTGVQKKNTKLMPHDGEICNLRDAFAGKF